MATIEGTDTGLSFIEMPAGVHAPIFYGADEGTLTLASLNAGNSELLYVGGGGINGAFGKMLGRTQKTERYAERHMELLRGAADDGDAAERYADEDPTAFSYVHAPKAASAKSAHEGVCFVDVFAPAHCPAGNARNAAMVYVAPPYGGHYADQAGFLTAIQRTGESIATAVTRYNAMAEDKQVPELEALRLCLYSSGIYNTLGAPSNDIALAAFAGLAKGLAAEASGLSEVQMPFSAGAGDPLFSAVKARYDP